VIGHERGVQLEYQVRRPLLRPGHPGPAAEVVGPLRRDDQAKVGAQDPVLVKAGHLIERASDFLEQRFTPLGLAREPVRVEPRLE